MLTESFIAATESVKPPAAHLSSNLKDVGVFLHEFQPQIILRQGFKKSSTAKNCLAYSTTHIFAAQAGKAVIHVYSRMKGNQEATVPFPQKITSLTYIEKSALLIVGAQDGRLILWETATGRVSSSSSSHIEPVTHLAVSPDAALVVSASPDSTIHVWSIKNLVSIEKSSDSFGNAQAQNEPIASLTQHRSAISVLALGHSRHTSTNFVVSASEDKTCYIWNLETLQVLRTFLLLEVPQSVVIDPADRAIYFGSQDGSVQDINLFEQQSSTRRSIHDNAAHTAGNAEELRPENHWIPPAGSEPGPAQCITLSYDGTVLLTGHFTGKILQWEVAKHRMTSEVTSLTGQSLTNLKMLPPVGFRDSSAAPTVIVPAVVKPRPELTNAHNANPSASLVIPADYALNVQVVRQHYAMSDTELALTSSELPPSFMDDAVQALTRDKVSAGAKSNTGTGFGGLTTAADILRMDQMEKELTFLRSTIANQKKLDQERLDRHLERMKRREAIGQQKREAFFAAKTTGKNCDEAMKPFMQMEGEIDAESDEEAVTNAYNDGADIDMKG